jgi:hypothetical protein
LNDKKPQRAQRTQRKRQSSVFSECWYEKINNELVRTPYEQGIWRNL